MLTRKGSRCFDAITNIEVGCPQIPIYQTLGTSSGGGKPTISPPPPPPPPGSTCCLSTSCPILCTQLTTIKGCLLGYELPSVPLGMPVTIPTILDLFLPLSAACQTTFNNLLLNFGSYAYGGAFPLTQGVGDFIQSINLGASTVGCFNLTLSIHWQYMNVGPTESVARAVGVKFCRAIPSTLADFNACADCNTLPSTGCVPITKLTLTASSWISSLSAFRSLPLDETNTYVDMFFDYVVTKSACSAPGPVRITQGTNCGTAVQIPAPIILSGLSGTVALRVKWDTSCPLIPCPGPYPSNMFEIKVATGDVPTATPFMVNVPLGLC